MLTTWKLGNSNIFPPLTDLAVLVNSNEVIVRSPRIFGRAHLSIAYSNQVAKGLGPITGGLLEETDMGYFYLDHDQRNTLSTVLTSTLPWRTWVTTTVEYGLGFLNGDGPAHLPPHTTVGIALGKSLGETWSLDVNALNIANQRFLLDNSNTFGGTHYVNPREVYLETRYRFHF